MSPYQPPAQQTTSSEAKITDGTTTSPTNAHVTNEKDLANNWYAKLHPIGSNKEETPSAKQLKQPLNLSIFFRIWLAVAVIIIVSSYVAFTQLFEYVKPTTQQVIEDTLVDTSKLLASSLKAPILSGELYNDAFQRTLDQAFIGSKVVRLPATSKKDKPTTTSKDAQRHPAPWYHLKTHSSFRVYVTDKDGIVIYDSRQNEANDEGKDYSRWNDVYLTLNGQYGARSTAQRPGDSTSSVMYVAQPITADNGELIGVVSVGKPVSTIVPYLDATRSRMLTALLVISALSLLMAGLVAWWLKQSMALVTRYTRSLANQTNKPYFYLGRELNELSDTIEGMKHRLENRAYVTDYVHTLTHELKSPLTAIRASGELLEDPALDEEDRLMLSQTITEQSIKLQSLIDRLLLLAKVEQPTFKLQKEPLELIELLQSLINMSAAKRQQKHLADIPLLINGCPIPADSNLGKNNNSTPSQLIDSTIGIDNHQPKQAQENKQAPITAITILADKFWLTQALQNILDNALYYANELVAINFRPQSDRILIDIFNDGPAIPDYAIDKVFNRYFSLSHHAPASASSTVTTTQPASPSTKNFAKKGTGLGLTLVKQVIEHHGGQVSIRNLVDMVIDRADQNGDILSSSKPMDQGNNDNNPSATAPASLSGVLVTIELPLSK